MSHNCNLHICEYFFSLWTFQHTSSHFFLQPLKCLFFLWLEIQVSCVWISFTSEDLNAQVKIFVLQVPTLFYKFTNLVYKLRFAFCNMFTFTHCAAWVTWETVLLFPGVWDWKQSDAGDEWVLGSLQVTFIWEPAARVWANTVRPLNLDSRISTQVYFRSDFKRLTLCYASREKRFWVVVDTKNVNLDSCDLCVSSSCVFDIIKATLHI